MRTVLRTFFNQMAATWDETVAEKDVTRLERMSQRLEIKPGSTVLDVGTGTGVFLPFILKRVGGQGRLVALDLAEEMLRRARAKGFSRNIEYLQADIASPPLSDEAFDAVVCYSSFPHFQNKPKALKEANRLLKKGGKLFICHTSGRSEINDIHRQIPLLANDILPGEDEMATMLSAAGFADIEIRDGNDNYLASARKPKVR
jgi:ubiquinone/menaquinone biosynthesis C-methylase UbiE